VSSWLEKEQAAITVATIGEDQTWLLPSFYFHPRVKEVVNYYLA